LGQSGPTLYSQNYERYLQKFKASGWNAYIVNGHDIKELLDTFEIISKEKNLPSVIIAKTIKGYRLENIQGKEGWHGKPLDKQTAEKAIAHLTTLLGGANCKIYIPKKPDVCSSVSCIKEINVQKLSLDNDKNTKLFDKDSKISTRKAYGYALASLGKEHKDIIVLDADVKNSTFTEIFGKESPEKFFQCFIAEQNMIGVAAGLARRGKIPFVATFGAFLTRAYDQLRMASIGQCSLRVCGSHCGVSIGQDGPSQMGLEDIAMISTLPNSIILYPSDGVSAYYLTGLSANYTQGISYVRTTRADVPVLYSKDEKFSLGGCKILKKDNRDVACIISAGITVHEALKAYELLKSQNIYVSIIDLYSIKPFDKETVMNVAKASGGRIVTVEDHYFYGGMGQIVASAVVNSGLHVDICAVNKISCSGTPEDLMKDAGIDYVSLAKIVTSGKIK
jgi:transketolase